MLGRTWSALTARWTVLTLLLVLVAVMTVAAIVPQAGFDDPGAAAAAGQARPRGGLVAAAGLDHVFSTWWFAALSLLFVLALSLSTLEQLRLARARMRQPPGEGSAGIPSPLPPAEVSAILSREGYRRLAEGPGGIRHVRNWSGFWGSFLLHAGMTLTVLSSVAYVLTEHRARLHVVSGQTVRVEPGTYPRKRGLLAREIPLPWEVNLSRVEPTFGANDQLLDVASQAVFTDRAGASSEVRVAVNDFQDWRGLVVYQLVKYGNAFFLELDDGTGTARDVLVELPYPDKRGVASYGSVSLDGGRTLKAKYFPSADHRELLPKDPQLVLRLVEGEQILGEATLQEGNAGRLGPWTVRLARVGWWTDLLFEGSLGTTGIFAGFAVLLLGSALTFFAVPREVIVRARSGGSAVQWRGTRFTDLYQEERERVLSRCTGGQAS
jgi:hypothetical protein